MRLGSINLQAQGLRLECECGHRRQFDLRAAVAAWGDPAYADVKARARCTACGKRKLSIAFTDTADGSSLPMAGIRQNIFHRCGNQNCLVAWWATPDKARAMISADGTLDDYKRAIACPSCGRYNRYHHVRLTDEPLPPAKSWMGMSRNEREAGGPPHILKGPRRR